MDQHIESNRSMPSTIPEVELPKGIDRRTFLMRHAVIGAASVQGVIEFDGR